MNLMVKKIPVLMLCLAITTAFAGCHEAEEEDPPGSGDDPTGATEITLTVLDAPQSVTANETFNVTVQVAADGTVTSSHFGAHYGNQSSSGADPSQYTMFLDKTSPHVLEETEIGETYTIRDWSFSQDEVGTIYYRAHVNTEAGDFWSDEQTLEVASG